MGQKSQKDAFHGAKANHTWIMDDTLSEGRKCAVDLPQGLCDKNGLDAIDDKFDASDQMMTMVFEWKQVITEDLQSGSWVFSVERGAGKSHLE